MPGTPWEYSGAIDVGAGDDNNDLKTPSRALYIGGAGDVTVIMQRDGGTHTFKAVPVGTILPVACTRVKSTGTTATLIEALY